MADRTEEDIVTQSPLEVILGGKKISIKLLTIKEAKIWRKKVVDCINQYAAKSEVSSDNPEAFLAGLSDLLVGMPDAVMDLFFNYARELDRKAIEAVANDVEIAAAWEQVQVVAFPLTQSLGKMRQA